MSSEIGCEYHIPTEDRICIKEIYSTPVLIFQPADIKNLKVN